MRLNHRYLNTIKLEFSCIGVSKPWLNSNNIDLYNDIPNCNFEHYICWNKQGGGVSSLINKINA